MHCTRWILAAALLLVAACTSTPPDAEGRLRDAATGATQITHDASGRVVAISTEIPIAGPTPEARADAFLERFGALFGLNDPSRDLRHLRTASDDRGGAVVHYERTHEGRRVYGTSVRVAVSGGGLVRFAAAELPRRLDPLGRPTVTAAQATRAAQHHVDRAATPHREPELVALDAELFRGREGVTELVWLVELPGNGMTQRRVFVHAQRGDIVFATDRTVPVMRRETFSFRDFEWSSVPDEATWEDLLGAARLSLTEAGPVEGVTPTADATAAHGFAGMVYRYFETAHQRNSVDGRGMTLRSYTDANELGIGADNNAFWDGDENAMVYGDGVVSLDIAAHEMTHGIVQHTCDLEYALESGALNESLADVFGAFVDTSSPWTIGDGSSLGVIRSLADPLAHRQPHHTDLAYEAPDRRVEDYTDYGGVHINSGIPNHAVYLLVIGGTHAWSGIAVTGIGSEKTAAIVYRAMTTYLGPASQFIGYRAAAHQAARDLMEDELLTAAECGAMLDAFAAVGIGPVDTDGDCIDDENDEQCDAEGGCERPTPSCDDGCPAGRVCNPRGVCVPDVPLPWECRNNADCPTAQSCLLQQCFDECNFLGCGDCEAADGCGWCGASEQCIAVARAAECGEALGAACSLEDEDERCAAITNCRSCNNSTGCGFCEATGVCMSDRRQAECGGSWQDSPGSCIDCSHLLDCEGCSRNGFCGWCASSGTCLNAVDGRPESCEPIDWRTCG